MTPHPHQETADGFTDAERVEWLAAQAPHGGFHLSPVRDSGGRDADSEAFHQGMRVKLFTVASQHVYGRDLRDAIHQAIREAQMRATGL